MNHMKKIFTLVSAAVLAFSVSAVELTVSTETGTILSNGNVLFNTPDPEWLSEGEVWIMGHVSVDADETVSVDVTATLTSGVEKYGICFLSCRPVEVGKSTSTKATIGPGHEPLGISVEPVLISDPWTPDVVRTYIIDVEIKSGSETLKTFSIIVSNDEEASVGTVAADSEAFTVSGRYIYWNLPQAPGLMTIYTVDGRVADQKRLSTASGSVSLVLPAGLYIWSTPAGSGKIYLRD